MRAAIIRGRVAVYSKSHILVESKIYYSSLKLKQIMLFWMSEYPAGHYIQVRPYFDEDGLDKKLEQKQILRMEIKKEDVKFVRPAATYTNLKTYNYGEP